MPVPSLSPSARQSFPRLLLLTLAAGLALCGGVAAQPHPYHVAEALEQPRIFAPGVISTDAIEYGPAFTPDGTTLYFTRRASWRDDPAIYVSHFEGGAWQTPQVASFSGTYADEYPALSPDGTRLYFASKRPADGGAPQRHNDIWLVERTDDGWGTPRHLKAPISSDHIDSHPSVAADGTLYFHSNRPGGPGGVDLYHAHPDGAGYREPQPLPFNSEATDGEACLDPQGRFIIFYSERAGTRGNGDLFIVHRRDGVWSAASNLGDRVNTADYEWTPALSPDGRYLFYAHLAGNDSDLYQIDLDALMEGR